MARYSLVLLAVLVVAVGCGQSSTPSTQPIPSARVYTTHFSQTENPLSEGGNWIDGLAVGLDWSNVQTVPGFAFGTQTGLNDVNDSTALLTGMWGSNQTAQATVVINVQGPHKEIELRLNSSLSAHVCTGYELSFEIDGLVNIVRWNGPFNNFTVIGAAKNLPGGALVTGDVLYGTNVGGLITAYVNGVQVNQVTDTTYTGGSPGIGFFLRTPSVTNSDFGVASFTATD